MMERFKATYRDGIKITDLKPGDTIYIQKIVSDFMYNLECEFVEYSKGIVKAKVVHSDVSWDRGKTPAFPRGMEKGKVITARKTKCFLWGKRKSGESERCHWFNEA